MPAGIPQVEFLLCGLGCMEGPLWHSHIALYRSRPAQWLAVLKSNLETLIEVVAALEHLALRIFFIVEVFLLLLRHR